MSTDPTLPQGDPARQRSEQLSLRPSTPPGQVPGYEFERFLGEGAYGEVWVALEKNTGRRVAVKFYTRGGGLDWSLLSREVEKLAFLSADRYVVQLIGVGWDAAPPYYIMEHLERGSLAERLQSGPLSVAEAVDVFHDVAVGLLHAHEKGVLHCDLKPANILLDQDGKPRLADFGQSRLSTEQVPALGTLFYMAPEQADLTAVPDARWDVYALGALLYCMLTGSPPYRTPEAVAQLESISGLEQRLTAYRRLIRHARPAGGHRHVRGVDHALAEIVDRCLAVDPKKRYPNVQVVLDALAARAIRRERRPMMIVGALGPMLLLAVVAAFAWQGFSMALRQFEGKLIDKELRNNALAALRLADLASKELTHRSDAVEQVAASPALQEAIARAMQDTELRRLSERLSDPRRTDAELDPLREKYRQDPHRKAVQKEFDALIPAWMRPPQTEGGEEPYKVASWFLCDADGVSMARSPESKTIGRDFAWRSFFLGTNADRPENWRPPPGEHLKHTALSAVFQSRANYQWIVAIATPVFDSRQNGKFLGVVALTVRAFRFAALDGSKERLVVLVDLRPGDFTGMILQHPLYPRFIRAGEKPPMLRLSPGDFPVTPERERDYRDPAAALPGGQQYNKHWLAWMTEVQARGQDVGWGVIVQEPYEEATGSALRELRAGLIRYCLAAVAMVVVVLLAMWGLAFRLLHGPAPLRRSLAGGPLSERSATATTPTGTGLSRLTSDARDTDDLTNDSADKEGGQ